ncbi:hypothetical protein FA13DRAFT_1802990 [Coprinellus micaceus]|uniref:Uncharacterized protein n=1 Tax=Coprinellus micaceus TaxID=71717 RepID=A0A4Y7SB45_COPMI|nr:hypothetical protein FA13DRAFT_1802990 [Coprinellus micaceus]
MPCKAIRKKTQKECQCPEFTKREKDDKCSCRHSRDDHQDAAKPQALRPHVQDILKMFQSTSAQPTVPTGTNSASRAAAAREETNTGFRPKPPKAKPSDLKEEKSANSTAKTYKIRRVILLPGGITSSNQTFKLRTQAQKFPNKSKLEEWRSFGLVCEELLGKPLEFKVGWGPTEVDAWFRTLFPQQFEWLDRFGTPEPGRFHWMLAGKEYRRVYLYTGPTHDGAALAQLRGHTTRAWTEWEVRFVTHRAIPEKVYQDWPAALMGPLLDSEEDSLTESNGDVTDDAPAPVPENMKDNDSEVEASGPTLCSRKGKAPAQDWSSSPTAVRHDIDEDFQPSDDDLPTILELIRKQTDQETKAGESSNQGAAESSKQTGAAGHKRTLSSTGISDEEGINGKKAKEEHGLADFSEWQWEPESFIDLSSPSPPPAAGSANAQAGSSTLSPPSPTLESTPSPAPEVYSPTPRRPTRVFADVPPAWGHSL